MSENESEMTKHNRTWVGLSLRPYLNSHKLKNGLMSSRSFMLILSRALFVTCIKDEKKITENRQRVFIIELKAEITILAIVFLMVHFLCVLT